MTGVGITHWRNRGRVMSEPTTQELLEWLKNDYYFVPYHKTQRDAIIARLTAPPCVSCDAVSVRTDLDGFSRCFLCGQPDSQAQVQALEKALRRLRNDVLGCLNMDPREMRELIGHTNYRILRDRIKEADTTLAAFLPAPPETEPTP